VFINFVAINYRYIKTMADRKCSMKFGMYKCPDESGWNKMTHGNLIVLLQPVNKKFS